MTYQYNITRYRANSNARLWTDRIFLSLLIVNTLVIVFYNTTTLALIIASGIIVVGTIVTLLTRRHKVRFVEINDGNLDYFDSGKGEMVSVSLHDITHISTKFCELKLHTNESIHTLNLGLIRNEKARWEIKEVIREMARRAPEFK